jgi:hypothetical protein
VSFLVALILGVALVLRTPLQPGPDQPSA